MAIELRGRCFGTVARHGIEPWGHDHRGIGQALCDLTLDTILVIRAVCPAARSPHAAPRSGDAGRVEGELRAASTEVTIRALWVELRDRAGHGDELDVKAAAALAGMACGLRAG